MFQESPPPVFVVVTVNDHSLVVIGQGRRLPRIS